MHSSLDAVKHLEVKLGQLVLLVSRSFLDISEGRSIDNVTDDETLDGLILGDGLSSGDTSDTLDVSSSVLISSVVSALDSHD